MRRRNETTSAKYQAESLILLYSYRIMKILITGGAGFLGYHLAQYFQKKGAELTLLDIHGFDKKEYPGNYNLVIADVRDKQKVLELSRGVDYIIHCAAALPLSRGVEIMDTNVNGIKNVLEAGLRNKVKRVIHISSTAVYGVPKVHPIYETAPLVGVGPYGKSKIAAEDWCGRYMKKGLNVTVIRPKTFVGIGRLGVFEILFDWIHDGKRIPVIGSGNNLYQLLEVEDLVEAIYLFTQKSDRKYNDFFNIGAEKYGTVAQDLGALFAFAKSGSQLLQTPAFLVKKALWFFEKIGVSPLYQWVYDTADKDSFVSIDKLKKTLNWQPRYSNSQALIRAYTWYLAHYKHIKSKQSGTTHTVGWKQGILGLIKKVV